MFPRGNSAVGKESDEFDRYNGFAELQTRLSRYWLVRVSMVTDALAVRHGGLNGYQGQ